MLAENLSFSKTAEQLFLTQSALSRHISYLEEVAGVQLLLRDTHSVVLTTSGEMLSESFKKLLQDYDLALNNAALNQKGYNGSCRLGILYYGSEEFMEPVVDLFRAEYPNIHLSYYSYQPPYLMECLLNDAIDIGQYIYWDRPGRTKGSNRKYGFEYLGSEELGNYIEKEINFHKLRREKFILVVSENHKLAGRECISVKELENELFLFFEGNAFSEYCRHLLISSGIMFRECYMIGQVDTLGMAVKETGGIALQPKCIQSMKRSYLKYIDIVEEEFSSVMCLAYKKSNTNPAVPFFVDTAKKIFLD